MCTRTGDPDEHPCLASALIQITMRCWIQLPTTWWSPRPPVRVRPVFRLRLAAKTATTLTSSEKVLVLTFSNQARTQLEREASRQLPPALRRRIHITNYHRFFWQGVSAYCRALGLPMQLDIGSIRRRRQALESAEPTLAVEIQAHAGLIESLAEHSFPEFRDRRTPGEASLERLLKTVEFEQQKGRLVFDDLGALFWSVLNLFPSVDQAYTNRYPVVIADEHQDASALQDAVVRRLGQRRLVVFADEMQLIHEFRGASEDRLAKHLHDAEQRLTLRTPHRWHGAGRYSEWLVAFRRSLLECRVPDTLPNRLRIQRTRAQRGFNGMKPAVHRAVTRAFRNRLSSVAVLARRNKEASALRSYLSKNGLFPRQVGTQDFEEARHDIERLPLHTTLQSIAHHCLHRLQALVPTLNVTVANQVRARLEQHGVNLARAGANALPILRALESIYSDGPRTYFKALVAALQSCEDAGHHLPRKEAVWALRLTANAMNDGETFEQLVERYSEAVLTAAHVAPRIEQGLFVMTAHQAKGKEFDAVVLADGMDRYWPDNVETRRLFYVALTRATKSLTIVAPDGRASPLVGLCGPQSP